MSQLTPVVAKEAKVAEEVLAPANLQAQRRSELTDKELLWLPLALSLQPPRPKIQAGSVGTEPEDTLRDRYSHPQDSHGDESRAHSYRLREMPLELKKEHSPYSICVSVLHHPTCTEL